MPVSYKHIKVVHLVHDAGFDTVSYGVLASAFVSSSIWFSPVWIHRVCEFPLILLGVGPAVEFLLCLGPMLKSRKTNQIISQHGVYVRTMCPAEDQAEAWMVDPE